MKIHSPFTCTAGALLVSVATAQSPLPHGPSPDAVAPPRSLSSLFWGDYDDDGFADAWVVQPDRTGRLLHNSGDGTFEDVTQHAGLADLKGAHMATWADANGDGRLDLYLAAYRDASRLLVQTEARTFEDATAASGLPKHAEPLDALWFDYDGDRRPDLWLTTLHDDLVYHNAGDGRFEKVDLGLVPRPPRATEPPLDVNRARRIRGLDPIEGDTTITSSSNGPGGPGLPLSSQLVCTIAVQDASSPTDCLPASSDPILGHLYPITNDWFVESGTGNVGIGTTTPGAKLDVAGDVRADGQLVSTATTGAPLSVASSDLVTGLNADQLDGLDSSVFSQLGNSIGNAELEPDSVMSPQILDGSITAADLATDSVGSAELAADSVGSSEIAADAVGASELADDSVSGAEIVDSSITSADLGADSVGPSELAADSVTGSKILDASVTAADLASNSVGAAELASDSVTSDEITDGTVTSADLAPGAVGATELAPNSVTTATIVDATITSADLGPGSVGTSELAPNAVTGAAIADASITSADLATASVGAVQLAADSVTGASIADGSVGGADLGVGSVGSIAILDGSIGSADLASDSVGDAQLAANSVSGDEIVDGSISLFDLGPNSVESQHIQPGAVTTSAIALGAVETSDIATDAVKAAQIAAGAVGPSELNTNAVNSGHILDGTIRDADISPIATIAGTKIDPDFGGRDLMTTGTGTFGDGFLEPWQVKGNGAAGPTNGYLGAQGALDYDGVLSADWSGLEIGVIGISTGGTTVDNYGVIGHSNLVGVRGEHSADPSANWAELGKAGVGIEAAGATNAGVFNGNIQINNGDAVIYGQIIVNDSTAATPILFNNTTVGSVAHTVRVSRNHASSSGNDMLEIAADTGSSSASQLIEAQVGSDIEFRVDADGDVFCDGSFFGGGADYAEMVKVTTGAASVEAGDVMVIDVTGTRALRISSSPYSSLVAGIYSTKPGFIGSERDWDGEVGADGESIAQKRSDHTATYDEIPLAIVGIVPCKVVNENGPILPGDLLVTSSVPGHAMVGRDAPAGTIVGKALERFDGGSGTIKVLVTLQ